MKLPKYWQMRDGNRIKISEMETSHLINSIAMIERLFEHQKNEILGQAFYDYQPDWYLLHQLEAMTLEKNPSYVALWDELNKRG